MATEKSTRARNEHYEATLCQCGCNQIFMAHYITRKPRYANKIHKARISNIQRRVKREARIASLFRIRKLCRKEARVIFASMLEKFPETYGKDKAFKTQMIAAIASRLEREVRS